MFVRRVDQAAANEIRTAFLRRNFQNHAVLYHFVEPVGAEDQDVAGPIIGFEEVRPGIIPDSERLCDFIAPRMGSGLFRADAAGPQQQFDIGMVCRNLTNKMIRNQICPAVAQIPYDQFAFRYNGGHSSSSHSQKARFGRGFI